MLVFNPQKVRVATTYAVMGECAVNDTLEHKLASSGFEAAQDQVIGALVVSRAHISQTNRAPVKPNIFLTCTPKP